MCSSLGHTHIHRLCLQQNPERLKGPTAWKRHYRTWGIILIYCVSVVVELFSGNPDISSRPPANSGKCLFIHVSLVLSLVQSFSWNNFSFFLWPHSHIFTSALMVVTLSLITITGLVLLFCFNTFPITVHALLLTFDEFRAEGFEWLAPASIIFSVLDMIENSGANFPEKLFPRINSCSYGDSVYMNPEIIKYSEALWAKFF